MHLRLYKIGNHRASLYLGIFCVYTLEMPRRGISLSTEAYLQLRIRKLYYQLRMKQGVLHSVMALIGTIIVDLVCKFLLMDSFVTVKIGVLIFFFSHNQYTSVYNINMLLSMNRMHINQICDIFCSDVLFH